MKEFIKKHITLYKIKRHESRPKKTGFFVVNVRYAKQYGLGFQISTNKYDYGLSIYS